jgi:hypothetical protein
MIYTIKAAIIPIRTATGEGKSIKIIKKFQLPKRKKNKKQIAESMQKDLPFLVNVIKK